MSASAPLRTSLIDTHAHLDFEQFAGEEAAVIERARQAGVGRIINVGTTLEHSQASVALAERFDTVWAAVGIHPHDATDATDAAAGELAALAAHERVVAIGEVGFDTHYPDGPDQAVQVAAFRRQAGVAKQADLPLIIHSRDADEITIAELKTLGHRGVVHCFTGSLAFAEAVLDLGFLISFTAPITYPKNDALREVVARVPLDRLMVETDCPFLAPQDKRGQRNEPAYVAGTAAKVAELKDISLDEVAAATTANAARLFGLPMPRLRQSGIRG